MNEVIKVSTTWGDWREEIKIAKPITANKMEGTYRGSELDLASVRIGGDDHLNHPSRNGCTLKYKDGRVEKLDRV